MASAPNGIAMPSAYAGLYDAGRDTCIGMEVLAHVLLSDPSGAGKLGERGLVLAASRDALAPGGAVFAIPRPFGCWTPNAAEQAAGLGGSASSLEDSGRPLFAIFCAAGRSLDSVGEILAKDHGRYVGHIFARMALGVRLIALAAHTLAWDALYIFSAGSAAEAERLILADPYAAAGVWTAFETHAARPVGGAWLS